MSLFNSLYGPVVESYREYCENLAALAKDAKCRFRIAAYGSARKATPITEELAASWTRLGWDTVTGGGPGQMHLSSHGAYEERSKMIVERARALFDRTLEIYPELLPLSSAFDPALALSLDILAPSDEEYEGLKVEAKAARFIQSIRSSLKAQATELGLEAVFEEASLEWEKELRKYSRGLAKIFSCALYFPMEPPNRLADQVLLALDFPSRLRFFEALCSAFVILPFGGIGTLLELMLAVQWVQLLGDKRNLEANPGMLPINQAVQAGYMPPIIVMNYPMWALLRMLLIAMWRSGTINKEDIGLIKYAGTVPAVNKILADSYEEWLSVVACEIREAA